MKSLSRVIILLVLISLSYSLLIKPNKALAADDLNFTDTFATSSGTVTLQDYSTNYVKLSGSDGVIQSNELVWPVESFPSAYLFNVATISANVKAISVLARPVDLSGSANTQLTLDNDSPAGLNSGYQVTVTLNSGIYVEASLFNCYVGSCTQIADDMTTIPTTSNYLITFKQNSDNTLSVIVNDATVINNLHDTSAHQFNMGYVLFGGQHIIWQQINITSSNVAFNQQNPFCQPLDLLCNLKNLLIPNGQYDNTLFASVNNNINMHVPFAYVNAALSLDFSQTHAATSSVSLTIPMIDQTASTSGQMYHPRILGVSSTAIHWTMPETTKHNISQFSYPIFTVMFVMFFIDFIIIAVHIMLK